MIESIEFKNFKALRDTTLPLGPCTIIIGPNGSGKSTVLQALEAVQKPGEAQIQRIASFGTCDAETAEVSVRLNWKDFPPATAFEQFWTLSGPRATIVTSRDSGGKPSLAAVFSKREQLPIAKAIDRIRVFSLDANRIATPSLVQGIIELASDGAGLATVLDGMRDDAPTQFAAIERQIGEWLPEFDCILFDRPQPGAGVSSSP